MCPLPDGNGLWPPQKLCSHDEYSCSPLACSFTSRARKALRVADAGSPAASQDTVMHCSMKPEILGEQSISGVPETLNCEKHWPQQLGIFCGIDAPPEAVGNAPLPYVVPAAARRTAIGVKGRMLG